MPQNTLFLFLSYEYMLLFSFKSKYFVFLLLVRQQNGHKFYHL